ncbi:DgyrCDS9054 [Dimorphilus gyrociliatus]|uniref:DgyrCDS9054 n=1 Tax=Dimorphilus gyrociliatus TaxID=2664684 RepID=A0A7I8VY74_9ANNE|nr:DgyrCDS9054 [Dimorphilus gyrociliatus]
MDAPPSYNKATANDINFEFCNNDQNVTYVDFAPTCTKPSGIFSSAEYQPFSELTIAANKWLNEHCNFFVEGCETIGATPLQTRNIGEVNTQETRYHIQIRRRQGGSKQNNSRIAAINVIKCLRLYVRPKGSNESPEPHQIGYLNISPQLISPTGIFRLAKYDSYDNTLKEFNLFLDKNPIPGKILNIEAVTIFRDDNNIAADGSLLTETSHYYTSLSTMLRVFYLSGPPSYEKIGSADFQPSIVKPGGLLSRHQFETLSETMCKVNTWLSSQMEIRVTNIQTLKINYHKALKPTITERIDYVLSRHSLQQFFNIVRVFYTTAPNSGICRPINLSCKIFIPAVLVTKMIGLDVYETLDNLYSREILPFIRYNSHAKPINIETLPLNPQENPEAMCSSRSVEHAPLMIATVRIYFDGVINEPPSNVMQPRPIPVHEGISCCSIL